MAIIDEIETFFGTKNLYEVLNVDKDASAEQVKKAYRKASLKHHPDRVSQSEKDEATKRFQVLAQVHFVLSDEERRKLYDEHGIIANEDGLDSEADWVNYWRLLFPKISEKDINGFLENYTGSEEEEKDLITIYNRFEGDMDKICETHIAYDEERTTDDLNRLIAEGKIKKFKKFSNEPETKKTKRKKRFEREARRAEKARNESESDGDLDSLKAMIQKKSQNTFDSMIAGLEAKYASKGTKRKRSQR